MSDKKNITIDEIISKQVEAIRAIPTRNIDSAVSVIMSCSGKVVTTGVGKAGLIARKVSATMSSTGTPSIFMHAGDAQHGDLGMLNEDDIILVFSNSGRTREVVETISSANNLYPDIEIITITSNPSSILARTSKAVIETGNYPELCPLGLAPTSSSLAMLCIGDILAIMIMQEKNFCVKDFHKRHHGGYLGKMLSGKLNND